MYRNTLENLLATRWNSFQLSSLLLSDERIKKIPSSEIATKRYIHKGLNPILRLLFPFAIFRYLSFLFVAPSILTQ